MERQAIVSGEPVDGESFDLCVLSNAVHWSPLGDRLEEIASLIGRKGALLIDDIFLDNTSTAGEFGVDWLTHGGVANRTVEDVVSRLQAAGMDVEVRRIDESALMSHIIAKPPSSA